MYPTTFPPQRTTPTKSRAVPPRIAPEFRDAAKTYQDIEDRVPVHVWRQKLADEDISRQELHAKLARYLVCPLYYATIKGYPTNEFAIRLNPSNPIRRDSAVESEHKITAIEVEKGVKKERKKENKGFKKEGKKKSNEPKPGWGGATEHTKFTAKVKKTIRRRAAALEAKFGKECIKFLTITLPGSTDEARQAFAYYSSYYRNLLNNYFQRIFGKGEFYYIAVWEMQKRGALHLHVIVASEKKECFKKMKEGFKKWTYRSFKTLSEKAEVDMFERKGGGTWRDEPDKIVCSCEDIKKSVAAYLSKYLSKGESKGFDSAIEAKEVWHPVRWASYSNNTKKLLEEETIECGRGRISAENVSYLVELCHEIAELWSEGKYAKPLFYKDKYGYGMNIKLIVKPEHRLDTASVLISWFDGFEKLKDIDNPMKFPSIEYVNNKRIDEAVQQQKLDDLALTFGDLDGRLWQKEFRKNRAPVPGYWYDKNGLVVCKHGASCVWTAPQFEPVQLDLLK